MKIISHFAFLLAAIALLSYCVLATDYKITTGAAQDYYKDTSYEDAYGSQYNYGDRNASDFDDPLADSALVQYAANAAVPSTGGSPGSAAVSSTGSFSATAASAEYGYQSNATTPTGGFPELWEDWPDKPTLQFTSAEKVLRPDGSIGTLIIPKLGIRFQAYDGTSDGAMAKGVGHFSDTSAWNGNVCLCGHNRGSAHNIGTIKNLKSGDIIQYETSMGARSYAVSTVKVIESSDWSDLAGTPDNRITIITCLANEPSKRVCVQAEEVRS